MRPATNRRWRLSPPRPCRSRRHPEHRFRTATRASPVRIRTGEARVRHPTAAGRGRRQTALCARSPGLPVSGTSSPRAATGAASRRSRWSWILWFQRADSAMSPSTFETRPSDASATPATGWSACDRTGETRSCRPGRWPGRGPGRQSTGGRKCLPRRWVPGAGAVSLVAPGRRVPGSSAFGRSGLAGSALGAGLPAGSAVVASGRGPGPMAVGRAAAARAAGRR